MLKLLKTWLSLLFIMGTGANSFAQENELLKVYSVNGSFKSFKEETGQLDLMINDSLVSFISNEIFMDYDSYSLLLDQNNNWSSTKNITQLNLDYFVNVYYDSAKNKIAHKLVCINIENAESLDRNNSLLLPKYDSKIYELSGILTRVELGDYLHIQINDSNIFKSFWVYPGLDDSTINKLFDLEGSDLNIPINLKYFKAINWIPEHGGPMLNETCIELNFESE